MDSETNRYLSSQVPRQAQQFDSNMSRKDGTKMIGITNRARLASILALRVGRAVTILSLGVGLVGMASAGPAAAASGSTPMPYFSGTVLCNHHTATKTTTLVLDPGRVTNETFPGSVKYWSVVQYSWDSVNWFDWFSTSPQSQPMSVGGATRFLGFSKPLGWSPNAVYYVRARDAFEFYDTVGHIVGTTHWLQRDFYTAIWNDSYPGQTATGGCGIPRA